jgi:CHAD domain-containing protein
MAREMTDAVTKRRLAALSAALPEAARGGRAAVHRARVATRRLREVLSARVGETRRARAAQKRIRRLTRLLGPVREVDVTLDLLQAEAKAARVPREATRPLRDALRDERRRLLRALRKAVDRETVNRLGKRVKAAARTGRGGTRASADRNGAWHHAARRAQRLSAAMVKAGTGYDSGRLHQVRIAAKKLRYALEAVDASGGVRQVRGLAPLREVQELLGRLHDIEVLMLRTRTIQGAAGAVDLRHSADLDRLVRRLDGHCRRFHAEYVGLRTRLWAVCAQTAAQSARAHRGEGA